MTAAATQSDSTGHVRLDVDGMHCASCAARVEGALTAVDGVVGARVNLALNQASVDFDPERTGLDSLVSAVASQGYSAAPTAPVPMAPMVPVAPLFMVLRRSAARTRDWSSRRPKGLVM